VNRILIVALAATALVATPALAQDAATAAPASFTGGHVGANLGVADDNLFGTEIVTYGIEAGYDFDLGRAIAGVSVEAQDSKDTGRDLAITGRVGAEVSSNAMIYALAGYSNLEVVDDFNLDGVRFGVGVEVAPASNLYVKLEQRYTNYELDVKAWQTLVGVGARF
jgi:outer membrane immunogenic protein